MGFKDNINQDMWGNPDDSVLLYNNDYLLMSPYKSTWLDGDDTKKNNPLYLNYMYLMYKGDLPVEIDETICPYGINKNSGIGNNYLMSGYKADNLYYSINPVKATTNTAKGQKPAFFVWGSFDDSTTQVLSSPINETIGYLNQQKADGKFVEKSVPSLKYGYSFINNLKYSNITVIPVIIAVAQLETGWNDLGSVTGLFRYVSSNPYYKAYVYQKQFTVWEYYNGTDTDGTPYTEKYPSILGVYACIWYQSDVALSSGIKPKIPNLAINTYTDYTPAALQALPEYNVNPVKNMPYTDDFFTSSRISHFNKPHYFAVIGHNAVDYTAFASYNHDYEYPNVDKYTSPENAIQGAFDADYIYNSYIIPDGLKNKVKKGLGTISNTRRTAIAWFEGLTESECYQHIAYLGLPFYSPENMTLEDVINQITSSDTTTSEFRQSLMYPNLSQNMVTTGIYAPYATSDSPFKDITWLFDIEQNYDPEYIQEGDESGDDYEQKQKDKGSLKTTYHNNTKINGFSAYTFNSGGIKSVKNIINSQLKPPTDVTIDDWIKLDWYGQDPGSFILAVNKFPCDVNPGIELEIITIGRTKLMIPNPEDPLNPTPFYGISARSQIDTIDFGTLEIKPYYNDFRDYAPYTNYIIHIPYLADYTLDPKIWLNHTCTIKIDFDIVTCNSMAEIWRDDMWYDTIYGTFGTPIPFLSYNTGGYQNAIVNAQANLETSKNAMTQSFLSAAVSVASTGVGIATGNIPLTIGGAVGLINTATKPFDAYNRVQNTEYNLKHTAPNPTGTSGVGGVTSLLTRNYCTLIISRPQPLHYSKTMYGKTIGFACCETGRLNNYHGLTVCSNTRFNSFSGTQSELAEIQQLLNTGVILP